MTKPPVLQDSPDFSLVLGGPLYQLFRKAHLSGDALELLYRRIAAFALITWLPLLLLSQLQGGAGAAGDGFVPFLLDIEAHVRFLVALPALLVAELVVHQRLRPVVQQFAERGIVTPDELPKFHAAIDSAMRIRNSVPIEVGLIGLVYSVGYWTWRNHVAVAATTWYATAEGGQLSYSLPGYWYAFVSIPLFQFVLLRWYMRLAIWFWLLWRVSRLTLRLTPTHPDRCGGLGFVGNSVFAFSPLLFAQGAMLSGMIANRIFHHGKSLTDFKVDAGVLMGLMVVMVLGPLCVFNGQMIRAKRRGLREYGLLASWYAMEFEEKWVRDGGTREEALMGSADIQSLADLGNSVSVVREMRTMPIGRDAVLGLIVATAAPLLPLVLTIMPLDDLLERLIKIVF